MDNEQKQKRTILVVKWLGALAIGFVVAPFIWIAIGGLVGLGVAAAVSFIGWKFTGWFAMKVANWRLKAIKAECAKNPVETLQNEHKRQSVLLEDRKKGIEVMSGAIRVLDETIDKLEREFPDSPELEQMNADHAELQSLEQSRREDWRQAYVSLAEFAKEIQRVSRIWDVAQAAAKARQQSGLTEGEWEAKLKTETSIDAIRTQLNTQLSALSTEKMQADADRVLKGRKSQQALPKDKPHPEFERLVQQPPALPSKFIS